jgi:RHS repeat-associated protein
MNGRIVKLFLAALLTLLGPVAHASGTVTYVYTDPQGTPLAEADASGTITATFDYKPYGSQALGSPKAGPGYTGHVNDPDTGFVYMQARYYDPVVGRFLSVDPISPEPINIYTFIRYGYVSGNPITKIDPNGEADVYYYPHNTLIVQAFSNNGSQFTDQQISQQGAALSGKASDGRQIDVLLVPGKGSDAIQINPNAKLNDLSLNSADRSHTDKIGGKDVQLAPNAQGPGTVGHEIGHALRAGDQYKGGLAADGKSKLQQDVPGATNIMKNAIGPANQQTIDEIEKGARSPENNHYHNYCDAGDAC